MKLRITIDGRTYEAEVEILDQAEESGPAYPPYQPPPATYPPMPTAISGSLPHVQANDPAADNAKVCRSPVTGLVIRVYVEPGQVVEANDLLMVLEAMKMETQVTAQCTGIVKSVNVTPGKSVKLHQTLIEFE